MTEWVDEPIRIAAYDPAWPARFEQERLALAAAIGDWAVGGIHHIGSTAVPGLDAKPIIDVLVGVEDLEASRACFDPLAGLDYLYAPYRTEEMHWFCKPHPVAAPITFTWSRSARRAFATSWPFAISCARTRRRPRSMPP